MGQLLSSRVTRADDTTSSPEALHYKYPAKIGDFFGPTFMMGGERFEATQPEAFLFGENNDLNFLELTAIDFPYPIQCSTDQLTRTLQSYVNIRRDSLKFIPVPSTSSHNSPSSSSTSPNVLTTKHGHVDDVMRPVSDAAYFPAGTDDDSGEYVDAVQNHDVKSSPMSDTNSLTSQKSDIGAKSDQRKGGNSQAEAITTTETGKKSVVVGGISAAVKRIAGKTSGAAGDAVDSEVHLVKSGGVEVRPKHNNNHSATTPSPPQQWRQSPPHLPKMLSSDAITTTTKIDTTYSETDGADASGVVDQTDPLPLSIDPNSSYDDAPGVLDSSACSQSEPGSESVPAPKSMSIEFTFDADRPCCIQVYFFATESNDHKTGAEYISQVPELCSKMYRYGVGANQVFSHPCEIVFRPSDYKTEQLVYNVENQIIPIVIHCVLEESDQTGYTQSHSTLAYVEPSSDALGFSLKPLKQKLFTDGACFLLQEIYGIENKLSSGLEDSLPPADDYDEGNSECVVCMSELRDTIILPCRHLCLCYAPCAETLRYKASNCPICRSPFRALLRIKAFRRASGPGAAPPLPVVPKPAVVGNRQPHHHGMPPSYQSQSGGHPLTTHENMLLSAPNHNNNNNYPVIDSKGCDTSANNSDIMVPELTREKDSNVSREQHATPLHMVPQHQLRHSLPDTQQQQSNFDAVPLIEALNGSGDGRRSNSLTRNILPVSGNNQLLRQKTPPRAPPRGRHHKKKSGRVVSPIQEVLTPAVFQQSHSIPETGHGGQPPHNYHTPSSSYIPPTRVSSQPHSNNNHHLQLSASEPRFAADAARLLNHVRGPPAHSAVLVPPSLTCHASGLHSQPSRGGHRRGGSSGTSIPLDYVSHHTSALPIVRPHAPPVPLNIVQHHSSTGRRELPSVGDKDNYDYYDEYGDQDDEDDDDDFVDHHKYPSVMANYIEQQPQREQLSSRPSGHRRAGSRSAPVLVADEGRQQHAKQWQGDEAVVDGDISHEESNDDISLPPPDYHNHQSLRSSDAPYNPSSRPIDDAHSVTVVPRGHIYDERGGQATRNDLDPSDLPGSPELV